MKDNLTYISKNNIEYIYNNNLTAESIIEFLDNGMIYRKFNDILKESYHFDDLRNVLIEGLLQNSDKSKATIAKTVDNWLLDKSSPKNREQVYEICFILHLNENTADRLLAISTEEGIHYRNIEDVVYTYALRVGISYKEANVLLHNIQNKYSQNKKMVQKHNYFTIQLKDKFKDVDNEEELYKFIEEYNSEFGKLHDTAYKNFIELLERLKYPLNIVNNKDNKTQKYSIEKIVDTYFNMNVPTQKKTANYSYLQRVIKKNWPGETRLLKMQKRQEDVSRKALLLLYLITEEFDFYNQEEINDFDYLDLQDEDDQSIQFKCRFENINLFLTECGMNKLDPGNPFDCLVLYAIKTQEDEYSSDKFSESLAVLFKEIN